jgi:hypothetical protein
MTGDPRDEGEKMRDEARGGAREQVDEARHGQPPSTAVEYVIQR